MSVWYEASGECTYRISSGLSIRKLLKEVIRPEGIIDVMSHRIGDDKVKVVFSWNDSLDGMDAAKAIKRFVDEIKRFDKDARVDVESVIRFLA